MVKIVKLVILALAIYSLFGLLVLFVFTYGSQSPYQEKQLTLFNFIIPYIVILGFIIYGSVLLFKKPRSIKSTRMILCFAAILEIIAVKAQVALFIWAAGTGFISEIIPILTGIMMIIYIFVTLIKIVAKNKKINDARYKTT